MKEIDEYSYRCGVMDCFAEMVKAQIKPMALSHPTKSRNERDNYIDHANNISNKYHVNFYLDDDPLLTDLFALSLNKDTYNIIFYKDDKTIKEYITLKELKRDALSNHTYDNIRFDIAYRFGKLLGYSDKCINDYICNNNEKE